MSKRGAWTRAREDDGEWGRRRRAHFIRAETFERTTARDDRVKTSSIDDDRALGL